MRRQLNFMDPKDAVAIYIYTYELQYETEEGDQIYGVMNRVMRLRDEEGIEYWRPLIYLLDSALEALPPYTGKLYRGINCPEREPADRRCWTPVFVWPSIIHTHTHIYI